MRIVRTAAVAAVLVLATTAWCQSEDPGKILDQANAEVTYMSFERALPLYRSLLPKAAEGSELWQAAVFGQGVCEQQVMPASKETMEKAKGFFQLLLDKAPTSKFAPRAMMNLGRLAELVDYADDTSDRETARQWYTKALNAAKGTPLEGEATLRIAATYIQTYETEPISKGLDLLRSYLQDHPKDLLASAMWQYMGETYFYPLKDYKNSLECYKKADALGLLEEGREGPVYWRMAVMADRYLQDRDTAIEYYKKIITKTPTSGKAYEAQLALKALGVEPPRIELFDIVGSQDNGAATTQEVAK
jgi:tetratricopeptide (TPR) repeat protein